MNRSFNKIKHIQEANQMAEKRLMKEEGLMHKLGSYLKGEKSEVKQLEDDIHRALYQQIAIVKPGGKDGNWNHSTREKRMEEILEDLQIVIDEWKNK